MDTRQEDTGRADENREGISRMAVRQVDTREYVSVLREIAEMAVLISPDCASLADLCYNMQEARAQRVQDEFREQFSIGDEWEPVPKMGTEDFNQRVRIITDWLADMKDSDPEKFNELVMG